MGYDEPVSKRPAAVQTPRPAPALAPVAPRSRHRVGGIVFLVVLLSVGGYLAVKYDMSDPAAAFNQLTADLTKTVSGLAGPAPQTGRGARTALAAPVKVATAETHDVPIIAHTIGTVLANSTVTVKSQVDGPLMSAAFREGQMVKKGDLLFRIDPAPFEAMLRQAEAQVQRDQAQLASAQADADRAVMLADRGIVSAQQRDQLVANAKALAATVAADEAAADRAKLNLGYTTIRSPIDGKTGPYIVFAGNQVHANDTAGLITITQIQPVKIAFNLPQGDLPQLQDQMRDNELVVGVTTRSDVAVAAAAAAENPERELPVKVDFIGNVVDDRTGTIEMRATFQNPELRLVPGQLLDVSVTLATLKNVVTVPHDAVNVGQDRTYIFVIDKDMKAQVRQVKVLYQDQVLAAVGSGVEAGERVVTDGQLRLNPGSAVDIVTPPQAGGAGANAQAGSPQAADPSRDPASPAGSPRRGGG